MGLSLESMLNIATPTITALVVFGLTTLYHSRKEARRTEGLQKALEIEIYHDVYEIMGLQEAAKYINNNPFAQSEDWSPITNWLKYSKQSYWAFESIIKESNISSLEGNIAEIVSFYITLRAYNDRFPAKVREIEEIYHYRNTKQWDDATFVTILNEKILLITAWCREIIEAFENKLLKTMPFLSQNNWEAFMKEKNKL